MMMMEAPGWLTALSWAFVAITVVCAALIAFDVFVRGRRQPTRTMDAVWPLSALYLGPVALALYARWGRPRSTPPVAAGGLAGGAASALAHLVGVPLVVLSGLTIAGIDLWPMILVIAVIATALLAGFEAGAGHGWSVALALALVTVLAFDVGMGGWMLLLHFTENMPSATSIAFWFLMQIGVVLGTMTALPVIRWTARRARAAAIA
ncbi:MAG: hypothetical protein AVDCRST_MAG30-1771 [uncultured Solirubrobacteraceae bacterium]|uniref:DUF4396 domain-containing protein n=1 Tax=uncultured Solirubrobacteraceae bacterium TaxID=1162706 RepID=A0A6J4SN31_9ACTN|nr:MAG: hypothetical protein AVDCRST_MAG30-1771 [uncultured Solirubrobacteraceae bacterium]